MTVAFTGHRPHRLGNEYDLIGPYSDHIRLHFEIILHRLKPEKGIVGMALGVDMIAAQVCYALGIPYIAALPCKHQWAKWPRKSVELWTELVGKASEQVLVTNDTYTSGCMQTRNIWMVDHSDRLIAGWDRTSGGTKNCIDYAIKVDKPIEYVYLDEIF